MRHLDHGPQDLRTLRVYACADVSRDSRASIPTSRSAPYCLCHSRTQWQLVGTPWVVLRELGDPGDTIVVFGISANWGTPSARSPGAITSCSSPRAIKGSRSPLENQSPQPPSEAPGRIPDSRDKLLPPPPSRRPNCQRLPPM